MNNIYRLKIYLKGRPKIWRRFLVEDNITFNKLHEIIQDVMGWQNYHLYEFEFNRSRISIPDEDSGLEASDSRKLKIKNLKINQRFEYTYDFGDSWEHIIAVEKIMPKEDNVFYPRCIEGELSCPPEDCGGIYRYSHLLSVKKIENTQNIKN